MRFCMPHWTDLRQAIDDRGLSGLVAQTGKEATDSALRQIEGTDTVADYDPLMNAHWAIVNNALQAGGLYLLSTDEEGNEYCPLCEVKKHTPVEPSSWVTFAADEQLQVAREKNLVPGVQ